MSGILYGSIGYFGTRLLEEGLTVPDFLLWRFSFSVILLFPVTLLIWIKDKKAKNYLALLLIFILGIILSGLCSALYFEAGKTIGTGLAMVISFTYPLFVVGIFILNETVTGIQLFGALTILCSAVIIQLDK